MDTNHAVLDVYTICNLLVHGYYNLKPKYMNYKEVCSERHNQLCSGINLVCVDQSLLDNHFISSRYEYVLFFYSNLL